MLRLKIQNARDRENIVVALANSGYAVRVKEEKIMCSFSSDYYVELLDFEGQEINKVSNIVDEMIYK